MRQQTDVVFRLDIDNSLLDDDRGIDDLRSRLEQAYGQRPDGRSLQENS